VPFELHPSKLFEALLRALGRLGMHTASIRRLFMGEVESALGFNLIGHETSECHLACREPAGHGGREWICCRQRATGSPALGGFGARAPRTPGRRSPPMTIRRTARRHGLCRLQQNRLASFGLSRTDVIRAAIFPTRGKNPLEFL